MDRRSLTTVTFNQAVEEFRFEMQAARKSDHTWLDYNTAYRYFSHWLEADRPIRDITKQDITAFMRAMSLDESAPAGIAPRQGKPRSAKTLSNYHVALSALWTWAVAEGYADDHVVRLAPRPKFNQKPIEPYTDQELTAMCRACQRTNAWKSKPLTDSERFTASRDLAIILVLADTGLRNAELRNLTMNDLDWKNNRLTIRAGKGDKSRILTFGNETRKALRRYVQERPPEAIRHGNHLFTNMLRYKGHPMTSESLTKLIARIGKAAGVQNATPHRFRHTAAVKRLQNGMDAFQVKEMLGHSRMDTTLRYVRIAQVDLQEAMRRTSPMDNLRL